MSASLTSAVFVYIIVHLCNWIYVLQTAHEMRRD